MNKPKKKDTLAKLKSQRITELEEQLTQTFVPIERFQKLQEEAERLRTEVMLLKQAEKRLAAPFARRKWVDHSKSLRAKYGSIFLR